MSSPAPESIDAYIATFPKQVQAVLQKLRRTIAKAAPDADQTISYRIPTFKLNGHYLIYFAGFKTHIGVYPVHASAAEFGDELARYASGKATLKFALDQPLPLDLITKVVKAKVRNANGAAPKKRATRA